MNTTQTRRPAAQTQPSTDKTTQVTTALAKRLEQTPFLLPAVMRDSLAMQGFREETINNIAACCLAVGVPPILLSHPHNLAPIQGLVADMIELGYRRGDDFHIAIYNNNQVTYDEFGQPGQKADLPTVVVMPTITRYEQNAKEDSRLDGVVFQVEAEVITDPEEAKKIFDQELSGTKAVWSPKVRVARAVLYKYLKSGIQLGSGKGQEFYGFYLPMKTDRNGNVIEDYVEAGKVMANYSPGDIAIKRAKAKAYKAVSRAKMPRDNRTAADRMAMIAGQAIQNLQKAQLDAEEYGISLEEAIIGEIPEAIEGQKAEVVKEAEEVVDATSFAAQTNSRADVFADLVAESVVAEEKATQKVEEIPFETISDDEPEYVPTQLGKFYARFDEQMASDEAAHGLTMHLAALQSSEDAVANSSLLTQVLAAIDRLNEWETRTVIVDGHTTSLPMLTIIMLSQAAVDDQGKAKIKHQVALYLAHVLVEKNGSGKTNPRYDELSDQRLGVKLASQFVWQEFGQ
jgi:hypothetical protein